MMIAKIKEDEFLSLEDSVRELNILANTYLESANTLKQRIDHIKNQIKTKQIKQHLNENRLIILQAEYHYLIRTASQLQNYYN